MADREHGNHRVENHQRREEIYTSTYGRRCSLVDRHGTAKGAKMNKSVAWFSPGRRESAAVTSETHPAATSDPTSSIYRGPRSERLDIELLISYLGAMSTPTFHNSPSRPENLSNAVRSGAPAEGLAARGAAFVAAWTVLTVAGAVTGCGGSSLDPGGETTNSVVVDGFGQDATGQDAAGDTTSKPDTAIAPVCMTASDCPAPKNVCRAAVCESGVCNTQVVTTATTCDDGDKCTSNDVCASGTCVGKSIQCGDAEPCTADYCDPAKGCQNIPVAKPCQTDDVCALHQCQAGKCVVVDANPCDDENACTTDQCDSKNGCQHKPLSALPCDDEDGCTTQDTCKFGQCVGKGTSCADGNTCTDDTCDGAGKCLHTNNNKTCSDGDKCTGQDSCSAGKCSGKVKSCEDGSPCTVNACNAATGQCTFGLLPAGTSCDDGDLCTTGEVCSGIGCGGGANKDCTDNNECTSDACNTTSGICAHNPLEGSPCGADNLCAEAGTCKAGACSGAPKDCNDNNPCTTDLCDPPSGLCTQSNSADGTACGEGKSCQAGVCL